MSATSSTTTPATTATASRAGHVSSEFPRSVSYYEEEEGEDECPLLDAWFSGDPEEEGGEGEGVASGSKQEAALRLLRSWCVPRQEQGVGYIFSVRDGMGWDGSRRRV